MKDLQKTEFVQPYPQPALGGQIGLNSEDIAKALGVEHRLVKRKIRRIDKSEWAELGWDYGPYSAQVEYHGKKQQF